MEQCAFDPVSKADQADVLGQHRSKRLKASKNMRLLSLASCSPEMNPVENIRGEVYEKGFRNRAFAGLATLGGQLAAEIQRQYRFDCGLA